MNDGHVHYEVVDGVATILFDRPSAHNAMTWKMYGELSAVCDVITNDPSILVAVFRGVGGEAFVAGTDIEQFVEFSTGDDGLNYERRIDAVVDKLERVPVPTIAVIEGWCMGGGLILAAACDFRIATTSARFGVPIARTLGNCLSSANMRRVVDAFGVSNAKRLLIAAESIDAVSCHQLGFVHDCIDQAKLDENIVKFCRRLKSHAPATMWAAKESIRRISAEGSAQVDDLIQFCYSSKDFREGVTSFLSKRPANWGPRPPEMNNDET
ncbi:MAG: enoyl-CoA hydratase/isomerase family protein [Betaproteobacteria bacterium]